MRWMPWMVMVVALAALAGLLTPPSEPEGPEPAAVAAPTALVPPAPEPPQPEPDQAHRADADLPVQAAEGRLLAADGTPIAGALVYRTDVPLDIRNNTWQAHWAARNASMVFTAQDGTFEVPDGDGPLHARAAGFAPASFAADVPVAVLQPAQVMAIAHRGGAAHGPENTLAAIHTAALMGAPWIEVDVRMTADRQLVVIHDESLDRTTDGTGSVALSTWEHLSRLDAGSWFHATYRGERLPSLVSALHAVKMHDVGVVIELKMERARAQDQRADLPSDALVYERTLDAIHQANLSLEQTVISSFGQTSSHACARFTANTCGWILRRNETSLAGPSAMLSGLDLVHVHHQDIHHQLVSDLKGACDLFDYAHHGCPRVVAYTVKTELDILRLLQMGVDGITSGDVSLLLRVLGDAALA